MPNPVLTALVAQRAEQTQFIEQLLEKIAADKRDMVDAERSNLEAARQRIAEIDAQIEPLEAWEKIRGAHTGTAGVVAAGVRDAGSERPLGVRQREVKYSSAGEFVVDHIRALGHPANNTRPDQDAAQRVSAALGRAVGDVPAGALQTTADTPGLLPVTIQGEILTMVDGARPFITSVGAKPLAAVPGKTFERPKVTQSTTTGEQTVELGELPIGEFKVDSVSFTKRTFGGALQVSRQDIDWTSPTAWNALITDLIASYSEDTEDVVANAFGAAVTQSTPVSGDPEELKSWISALYTGAMIAATANGTTRARARRLPNRIWCSVDMWATLGAVVDAVRATQSATGIGPGQTSIGAFEGSILDAPRIMVPGLTPGSMIIGRSELFEFYEERIGLLSAITPKNLGLEVAHGGYAAFGHMDASAFCKLTVA